MKLCVLVAALEQDADRLPEKMGLKNDAVIVNQCDRDGERSLTYRGRTIRILERSERGVGRSRNLALDEAEGDIILFADEDIVYDESYATQVIKAFRRRPGADLILFNVRVNERRQTYWNEREKRVHFFNCGRYPTFCCAARLERLREKGVRFSTLFGGGAPYSNGEDSLFFMDCIRAGLKVVAVPAVIGREVVRDSTWFHGFDRKFFYDRGVLYAFLYRKAALIWAARFVIAKCRYMCTEVPPLTAFVLMRKGIEKGKRLCRE
ncbi:MAG: glycosyltransferase family 2 protein [Lachnospiraceae bacterium]|nr:glycosyltransferase family 2 protein [Lachnospiraceae bacterium]